MASYTETKTPHRLITPGCVSLITVGNGDQDNLFSVAWTTALRKTPPMVGILCGKRHYSYQFINETGEFGLNIPDATIAKSVIQAGKVSGHEVADKFVHVDLTKSESQQIKAPLVQEAIARMECRVSQVNDMGGSVFFIAQILRAEVRDDCFADSHWNFDNGLQLIHHLGGNRFAVSERSLTIDNI